MSNGESDLDKLLQSLRPSLGEEKYVYCSSDDDPSTSSLRELDPLVTVREAEGLTLVLREEEARRAGTGLSTRLSSHRCFNSGLLDWLTLMLYWFFQWLPCPPAPAHRTAAMYQLAHAKFTQPWSLWVIAFLS